MSIALFAAVVFAPQAPPSHAQSSVAQSSMAPLSARGRVVDVLGEPLPAVVVWVTDADGRECARAATDGSGVFLLRGLPLVQRLRLHANASGRVDYAADLRPALPFRGTILLEDAGPLRGVVVDAAGAPIGGASVAASAEPWPTAERGLAWHADAVADAQGAFTFPGAPLRPCTVRVWAPGFALSPAIGSHGGDAPVTVTLDKGTQQARRVRVDGLPPGTAAVVTVIRGGGLPAPLREAAVQADGIALLWPLPFEHMVGVRAAGFTPRPVGIPAAADSTQECTFALSPLPPEFVNARTTLAAVVVDAMGQPLRGVDVIAATMDGMPCGIATSDADGKVAATVPVRKGVLCRLALGPGPLRLGDPHATLGEDGVTWLDVAADPDRVVKLHVLRAASVAGATGVPFAVVELAEVVRQGSNVGLTHRVRSTTDDAGRFDLQGLPGGSYRVIVHVGDQLTATADVEVAEGTAATIDKLDVPPTGAVTGVVTDAAGSPVAGVLVYLLRGTTDRRGRLGLVAEFQPVLTDRNGRYRMARVAPGDWLVQVSEQKPRPAEPVTVEKGRTAAKDLTAQR